MHGMVRGVAMAAPSGVPQFLPVTDRLNGKSGEDDSGGDRSEDRTRSGGQGGGSSEQDDHD